MKEKVLFVCIHNSARSQMAEEILRQMAHDRFEVESAGIEPGEINPLVVQVLKEFCIDISNKKTQFVSSLLENKRIYNYVITVCDEASAEKCPGFPSDAIRIHWSFEDPSKLQGSDQEKIKKIRMIHNQIYDRIKEWLV